MTGYLYLLNPLVNEGRITGQRSVLADLRSSLGSTGITSLPASRCRTAMRSRSTVACATSCSTRPCSWASIMRASPSLLGPRTTTRSGIRAVAGDGGRSDLLCIVATGAVIAGSLVAMSRLESVDWRSVEQRQMVYLWTHVIISGAALLLFWPKR